MNYIEDNFDRIYEILKSSFPDEELRTKENQKALLNKEYYHISVAKTEDEKDITGVLCFYEFDSFIFIEHFAVAPDLRGKQIGSRLLEGFLMCNEKPVVLEVEPETDDITRKRIAFYKKYGFFLLDYDYQQPPMRNNTDAIKLQIMSYPHPLNKDGFNKIKDTLYRYVYSVNI